MEEEIKRTPFSKTIEDIEKSLYSINEKTKDFQTPCLSEEKKEPLTLSDFENRLKGLARLAKTIDSSLRF